jgi:NAD(P)-dependent dehydrogenase (short-subunit alcohol dehydrogenase family)
VAASYGFYPNVVGEALLGILNGRIWMNLKDSVCVVTGAGSGIGRALSVLLGAFGARLALVGRTQSKLEDVVNEIRKSGGFAMYRVLDVSDWRAVDEAFENLDGEFGKLDVLINCAAENISERGTLETSPEGLMRVMKSTFFGTVNCTRAALPSMLKSGSGSIVNIASVAGRAPDAVSGMAYSAAKAAVMNFSNFVAREFGRSGIRMTVVIPGEVDTPLLNQRPRQPSTEDRSAMVQASSVAEVIAVALRMPATATIQEIVIQPTGRKYQR